MTYSAPPFPPAPSDGRLVRPTHPFLAFQKQEVDQSIGQRFEQQVQLYSQRLAVKSGHREMTYHALNQAANRIAHALLARPIGAQEPAALLIEEDTVLLAAMLGVLKAGRSFVPLDPSFPAQRTLFMLEDARCRLILTDTKNHALGARLAGRIRRLLNVEDGDGEGMDARAAAENPQAGVAPDAASYILYTSGSTGHPKGVVQNHRIVLHNVMKYTNGFRICAHDRFTLLFSISFGEAMNDIFCALLNGASVFPWHLNEQGVSGLASWLVEEGITIYHSVPTLFRSFVAQLGGHEEFPQLRVINLGGETVFKSDVELCRKHFSPACILVNSLGATETKLIRQFYVDKDTEVTSSVLPVGYEVEDTQVLLLNEAGREVGFNRIGEIAVRSRYLSVGYWRRPGLTEASFLPDPSGGDERLYRTGDLGRMRPDGLLEHLGRKDYQVKIRGHRVEPQEIEATLRQDPAVAEAVVLPREDSAGDKCLVAYIVPNRKWFVTQSSLRRFLEEQLPGYMVPAAFVMLDDLPLTPNGKVDRRALPTPDSFSFRAAENAYVQPHTPVEGALAGIWEEVLGLERVGIHDDFFELGGHSLLAVQVMVRLNKHFGVELPLRALFDTPTISGLALTITQTKAEAEADIDQVLAQVEQMEDRSIS